MRSASSQRVAFDEAALLAEAREAAGSDDFGDDAFRAPLGVLLASLAEAPLHARGVALLRGGIKKSLVTRLRANECFRRHPEIAGETIRAPIVVTGMMRSGTTLIQRLLAADPRHDCALGWEVGEPVPRPATKWDEPDPRIPDAEARDALARRFSPELMAIHPSAAHEAEEEIVFLADAFLSHVPEASCHVPAYRAWLDAQDFTPAYQHLKRMLQLLQWQKRKRGPPRARWVLKTPAHLGYLDTLFAVFPDAHVVHMHRHPRDTIPSGASLNSALWRMHADAVDPVEVGRQWLERMAWANARALESRERMDASRFTDVWYRDAVREPLVQVERIQRAIGSALDGSARAAMQRWLARSGPEQQPPHRYRAADFGLDERAIEARFRDYVARYVAPHERA